MLNASSHEFITARTDVLTSLYAVCLKQNWASKYNLTYSLYMYINKIYVKSSWLSFTYTFNNFFLFLFQLISEKNKTNLRAFVPSSTEYLRTLESTLRQPLKYTPTVNSCFHKSFLINLHVTSSNAMRSLTC